MPLTILAIADQVSDLLYDHFRKERWRHVDLVLSCGDLPPSYLDFLASSLNVPVLYVRGNHDDQYREEQYAGCTDVHGKIVTCKGLRIAGLAGCRRYNGGRYQFTEREMRSTLRRLRWQAWRHGPPDIILTHAPPAGCHDGDDLPHRGFECFNTAIRLWQPRYLIHGHVHRYNYLGREQVTEIGATTVMNAYPHQEIALPDPAPAIVPAAVTPVNPLLVPPTSVASVRRS